VVLVPGAFTTDDSFVNYHTSPLDRKSYSKIGCRVYIAEWRNHSLAGIDSVGFFV